MLSNIYCISLRERCDRRFLTSKVFEKYNLNVKYYIAEKDPTDGARGCFNSHTNIIKAAYKDDLDYVAIFEDDITSSISKKEFNIRMSYVIKFIKNNHFDIFYLGSFPTMYYNECHKISKYIYKIPALCAHAYILSRSGINKYKNLVYQNVPIDIIYLNNNNAFAIYPSIFYQREDISDISTNLIRNIPFKTTLMQWAEYYAITIKIPLIQLLIVIIIILFFLYILTKKMGILIIIIILTIILFIISFISPNTSRILISEK